MDLVRAWPPECAITAPDSTRTLVMAFEKVLMLQYTGNLKVPPRALSQAILKMQEDMLYDLSLEQAAATEHEENKESGLL